ncbi:hypothetical protein HMPREF9332_00915 [Alloprevotella rava F0323]|uniref:Bacterial surface protein 26-residue n=1 Tax=Alloprevotella rava F0323 TaxID=679199 RepID=G5GBG4_9BACT|nr:BspA family leucine-rich repeat surface protein [Alloprevotella rava]EHG23163.1 hypothetical protein HMPREF9332_00915 [Alloprevotella rava F0323]
MKKQLLKNLCTVLIAWFMALLLLPQLAQAQEKEAYVVKSSDKKTLTFYYDDQKSSRTGSNVWGIEETKKEFSLTYPVWSGTWMAPEPIVTTAIFDASFKDFRPQNTDFWFIHFTNLEEIKGLENLNTSEVSSMYAMFRKCEKLTQLDLSGFNTEKVQNMQHMFADCSSLTSLDLSNFKTDNVKYIDYMFSNCNSLTTIYCNNTWTCSNSQDMFENCTNLQGAVKYDASKVDVSMANPETGYFTKKESTGVATATLNGDASIQAIYSIDGRRLNELQSGLNIVRMSNGTTQKILRK